MPLYLLFAPLNRFRTVLNAMRLAHVLYIGIAYCIFICVHIISRSFVHSIVADREIFDISAILHFCVSNKKTF
jgi:hypothetical protein